VGGYINVGGYLDVGGDWYWSHASMPSVFGKMTHRRILPPSWQRDHWGERLGVDTSGCYDEIIARLDVHELLKQDKWTRTERWMLESLLPEGGE